MIANDQELAVTIDRITRLQQQVARIRQVEANPENYRSSACGFLAEIDRMQLEVREYLSLLPTEYVATGCTLQNGADPRIVSGAVSNVAPEPT